MEAKGKIDAGICGFQTQCRASSDDDQHVIIAVESGCEKIRAFAQALREACPVDAFQEISPQAESVVLSAGRSALKGCCSGCIVPPAVFKTMQVAAGLALPKDISIKLAKSE